MRGVLYQRIAALCKKNNISFSELAERVGFSESLIRKWRDSTSPSVDKVRKIAEYFGVSVDYLVGATDFPDIIRDEDIISIQRARSNMSNDDRKLMMLMLHKTFEKAFEDGESSI